MQNYGELLFVDDVRALQDEIGIGARYAEMYAQRTLEGFGPNEVAFISERESFYLASVSSTGWPYVQHRGGPQGFLKVLDETTLAFGDYSGNRQFVTMGHSRHDNRVALFLMDYENRARMKMLGHLTMTTLDDADPAVADLVSTSGEGKVERIATIDVVAIDWNCPKYIPQLVNIEKAQHFVNEKLKDLAAENARLKQEIARLTA